MTDFIERKDKEKLIKKRKQIKILQLRIFYVDFWEFLLANSNPRVRGGFWGMGLQYFFTCCVVDGLLSLSLFYLWVLSYIIFL